MYKCNCGATHGTSKPCPLLDRKKKDTKKKR